MAALVDSLSTIVVVLIPPVFAAIGIVLVAKINKGSSPEAREDTVADRMEGLVDKLQEELARRDEQSEAQDVKITQLRAEIDMLHRLVSACYRALRENNIELPRVNGGSKGGQS